MGLSSEVAWEVGYREGLRDVSSTVYTVLDRYRGGLITEEEFFEILDKVVKDYS